VRPEKITVTGCTKAGNGNVLRLDPCFFQDDAVGLPEIQLIFPGLSGL
jgi:hypothetical protein